MKRARQKYRTLFLIRNGENMKRTELRENIFKLLFVSMFTEKEEMPEQLQLYFEGLGTLAENDQTYMEDKVGSVLEKEKEIDEILNNTSKGWKTTRMSKVDLTILRLAVYEILFDADVPAGVAINEAVELAKQFGGDDSAAFINGILGKIAAAHGEKKEDAAAEKTETEEA